MTVRATDARYPYPSSEYNLTFEVFESNSPPVSSNAFLNLLPNAYFSWQAPGSDPDIPMQSLSYSFASPQPSGMDLSPSGVITWDTPSRGGRFTIAVKVSDQFGESVQSLHTLNVLESADVGMPETNLVISPDGAITFSATGLPYHPLEIGGAST